MKILALGGCGQQGRRAVKALLQSSDISQIIVADINLNSAQEFVRELEDSRVKSTSLDILNRPQLLEAMGTVDVVANFVGPFFRYAEIVVAAAIDAQVNYVDICDDTAPTLAIMDKYSSRAEAAGITVLMGMGASPGLLNVFARHAADQMDSVEDIRLFWNVSVNDIETDLSEAVDNAAIFEHGIEIIAGDVPQFIDGKLCQVPGGSGIKEVDFPHLGRQRVYFVAHPETVTLPRYIKAKNITNRGGVLGMDDLLLGLKELGLTDHSEMTLKGQVVKAADVGMAVMASLAEKSPPISEDIAPVCSDSFVEVRGLRNGESIQIHISHRSENGFPRMDEGTGISAAVGVLMVARGEVTRVGVHAPEGCVDPASFFAQLKSYGISVVERRCEVRRL